MAVWHSIWNSDRSAAFNDIQEVEQVGSDMDYEEILQILRTP